MDLAGFLVMLIEQLSVIRTSVEKNQTCLLMKTNLNAKK